MRIPTADTDDDDKDKSHSRRAPRINLHDSEGKIYDDPESFRSIKEIKASVISRIEELPRSPRSFSYELMRCPPKSSKAHYFDGPYTNLSPIASRQPSADALQLQSSWRDDEPFTIVLSNLDKRVDPDMIEEVISDLIDATEFSVRMSLDENGSYEAFCYVDFPRREDYTAALRTLPGLQLCDQMIIVEALASSLPDKSKSRCASSLTE